MRICKSFAHKGSFHLPVFVGELAAPLSKTPSYPTLSPVLLHYAEYLKNVYANAPLTYPDKLSPEVNTPYIKLALVKGAKVINHEDANEFTRRTLEGDLGLIFEHKEEISMDNMFANDDNAAPLHLAIAEGAPGIGKSTFALEICRQWPKMLSLQPFSLVVLLKLRDQEVRSARGVEDLQDSPADHPLLRSGNTKLIEVVGFGEEQIQEFTANVFGPESGTLVSFNEYLHVNPVIRSMMYNPLDCSIITEVFSETLKYKRPNNEKFSTHI